MANTGHATVTPDPDRYSDLIRRHGVLNQDIPTGNAEDLIRAHSQAQSRAVQKASLLPVDAEATAALDLEELAGQLDGGEDTVLAAAVRGNAIVAIAEDADTGRTYKTVLPANDSYVPPEEDPVQAETDKAESEFAAEIAKLRTEHAEELAKVRAEADAKLSAEIAALREELVAGLPGRIEAAQKEQETGAAKAESSSAKAGAKAKSDKPASKG